MKKRRSITSPIILAVLCAVGVHTVLFTDAGHRLQSSIVESDTSSHAEVHLVADGNSLALKVNVTATNVTKIEGTLLYDDGSIVLSDPRENFWLLKIEDQEFGKKFSLIFWDVSNITKWDTLATWKMTPVLPESHSVNLTDVKIYMTDGTQRLTTEGTGEF